MNIVVFTNPSQVSSRRWIVWNVMLLLKQTGDNIVLLDATPGQVLDIMDDVFYVANDEEDLYELPERVKVCDIHDLEEILTYTSESCSIIINRLEFMFAAVIDMIHAIDATGVGCNMFMATSHVTSDFCCCLGDCTKASMSIIPNVTSDWRYNTEISLYDDVCDKMECRRAETGEPVKKVSVYEKFMSLFRIM